jgi:hypothetical protein
MLVEKWGNQFAWFNGFSSCIVFVLVGRQSRESAEIGGAWKLENGKGSIQLIFFSLMTETWRERQFA